MVPLKRLSVLLLLLLCCSCQSKPSTLVEGKYDEAEMDAAITRARLEVDSFIAELTKGDGEEFAVKAPIKDGGETEHFWLTDVVYRGETFEGKIGNDPGVVTNVKFGQAWSIKKYEISDWMFMRGGKMHGNYTMRPLLKVMPKELADEYRSMLANP